MAPPVRLRELSQEAQLEVDGFAADMLRHLGLPADAEPAAVASAIDSWVETLRVDPARISDDQAFWLAARLGCLWGEAIVKAHGWMWREREVDGDWYLTVVEPRLRYFHDPVPCAQACLAGRGRNPDLESVLRSFGRCADSGRRTRRHIPGPRPAARLFSRRGRRWGRCGQRESDVRARGRHR